MLQASTSIGQLYVCGLARAPPQLELAQVALDNEWIEVINA